MLFFIFPWQVDVPQDRWPIMNWLIILVTVGIFVLQVSEAMEIASATHSPDDAQVTQAVTSTMVLDGWRLRGLFGYMWLHGGLLHLFGNMWFLWLFGNAVCAKIGNLRYLLLYVTLGVVAGMAHLTLSGGSAVGASGAINGIVGVYLVLFFENAITCYYFVWILLLFLFRQFTVSSYWMILFWLAFDIWGAARGGSGVAYFAHLGGFGAGFAVTLYLCRKGWITMERYEKSLWQWWQQRTAGSSETSLDAACAQLGLKLPLQDNLSPGPASSTPEPMSPPRKPVPYLSLEDGSIAPASDGRLHVTCACGKTLKLSPQYAGKVVRCPQCRAAVPVGHDGPRRPRPGIGAGDVTTSAANDGGHIRLTCTCGKRIKVPSRYAGRSGKCPQCGTRLKIPHGD